MKQILLWILAVAALSPGLLRAQDIAGNWQGTLTTTNAELRIVLKVSKAENGALNVVHYSIDRGGQPANTSAVTLQGGVFKFLVPAINGNYEGKMSADGSSIVGNWTQWQWPNPLPLTFMRATKEAAWEIPTPPLPPKMMAADADPSFEVATIKPTSPDTEGRRLNVDRRNFVTQNTTLAYLIKFAYRVNGRQIVGAPDWYDNDKFSITAVVDGEGTPSDAQWHSMVQKLIAERFKFKFHIEKRELSVYVLSVGKDGPKNLAKSLSASFLPGMSYKTDPAGMVSVVENATLKEYADFLQQQFLDRPVLDQTGITGRYDFRMTFTQDESLFGGHGPPVRASDNPAPDFFTAMQEQLGLKLDAVKTPADVMVIDHVEKPSEN